MFTGKKILVVDDDPIVVRSCKRALSEEGCQVEATQSGRKGLTMARGTAYDLMLADLKIPDLDGMKIVRAIRQERAEMPVVIITGYGTPESKREARELGVAVYVEKPFTPEEIVSAVGDAWGYAASDTEKSIHNEIKQLAESYSHSESALIQILLDVQKDKGYLSKEWLFGISAEMDIPLNRVYQAATFYKAFSLEPKGKHTIQVCTGTACHVRGAPTLADRLSSLLGVQPGKTTKDGLFTLETVNCLGCCALGPVIAVDDKYYSNPSPDEMEEILNSYRPQKETVDGK